MYKSYNCCSEKNNEEKNTLIRNTGATLIEAGNNFEEAAKIGVEIQKDKGLHYIHAANEPHLINGVGNLPKYYASCQTLMQLYFRLAGAASWRLRLQF